MCYANCARLVCSLWAEKFRPNLTLLKGLQSASWPRGDDSITKFRGISVKTASIHSPDRCLYALRWKRARAVTVATRNFSATPISKLGNPRNTKTTFPLAEREFETKGEMNRESGGAMAARRFSFSWADEVEREEAAEQQQQQQEEEDDEENQPPPPPRRCGETGEQAKANPFGAARPREVVLAEKGVDWRARDRELDDASRRGSAIRSRYAQAQSLPLARC